MLTGGPLSCCRGARRWCAEGWAKCIGRCDLNTSSLIQFSRYLLPFCDNSGHMNAPNITMLAGWSAASKLNGRHIIRIRSPAGYCHMVPLARRLRRPYGFNAGVFCCALNAVRSLPMSTIAPRQKSAMPDEGMLAFAAMDAGVPTHQRRVDKASDTAGAPMLTTTGPGFAAS